MNGHAKIHLWLTILWLAATPAVVIWLRQSVPFLVFISVYAVVIGHWSAFEAASPTPDPEEGE